jgi:hypothetical protein
MRLTNEELKTERIKRILELIGKIAGFLLLSVLYWGYFFFLALMAFNAGASKGMSFWAGAFFGSVYALIIVLGYRSLKE